MATPSGRQLQVFIPFALGYFLSYLYRVINSVLAPDLAADIGLGPADLGLLTAAYFITFAAFQLPLGILLDRFGPRRIEALLLLVAAAGAFVFSRADSLTGLVVGRGLIGFGVSACLMAAFKAFVIWFPRQRLPQINGFQVAAGGVGALTATTPVQAALTVTDWRGMFMLLSGLTLVAAAIIFWVVPEKQQSTAPERMSEQFRGLGRIFKSIQFWRIAPWATLSQASFLAVHGLWAGPWMRDVAGLHRGDAADLLMLVAAAMTVGYATLGTIAQYLARRQVSPMAIAVTGMSFFMLLQLMVVWPLTNFLVGLWMLFGYFGTAGILCYATLSQQFPLHMAGRVNTALNLLVFVVAFAAQWGIGAIIEQWPLTASGGYAPAGYQAAFATILLLQVVAALWYLLLPRFFPLAAPSADAPSKTDGLPDPPAKRRF